MSEKVKEKLEIVEDISEKTEKAPKRDWKTWGKGIAIGAGIAAVTLLAYSKFSGKDEEADFEDETIWTPMPDLPDTNNQ